MLSETTTTVEVLRVIRSQTLAKTKSFEELNNLTIYY